MLFHSSFYLVPPPPRSFVQPPFVRQHPIRAPCSPLCSSATAEGGEVRAWEGLFPVPALAFPNAFPLRLRGTNRAEERGAFSHDPSHHFVRAICGAEGCPPLVSTPHHYVPSTLASSAPPLRFAYPPPLRASLPFVSPPILYASYIYHEYVATLPFPFGPPSGIWAAFSSMSTCRVST
jgi:hypothetical protein